MSSERKRAANIKYRYGMSLEEYEAMLQRQGGVCAICYEKCASGKPLSVDHCHATGALRGLLCSHCNHGLGKFKDDVELLDRASCYLQATPFITH